MTMRVRIADLERDRQEIVWFLGVNLSPSCTDARYDWLYLQNPNGPARVWIASETGDRTVGVAAAFPRTFWIDGEPRQAWVLGDFCIAPDCRSLGPALTLQRACLTGLGEDGALCLDFPSQVMLAIYRRLGVETAGNLVRYVRVLRVDSKVRDWVPYASVQAPVAALGNWALRFQGRMQRVPDGVEIGFHEEDFGDEFSELDRRAAAGQLQTSRTAAYLNWRYRRHPLRRYQVLTARTDSGLAGYAVLENAGGDCVLADLYGIEENGALAALLAQVAAVGEQLDIERIHAPAAENSRISHYLRRAGFQARESCPVVVCASEGSTTVSLKDTEVWSFMEGDRES